MRATLPHEVASFLAKHGPSTAAEVALGVRARRADITATLTQGAFEVVEAPDGASHRSRYWNVSQAVPARRGGQSRATLMLAVLRDGRWHTRRDIWEATGRFFLTNNAATEIRRSHGYNIEYDRHLDAYRIAPAAAMRIPRAAAMRGRAVA